MIRTRQDLRNLIRRTGFDVVRFRGDFAQHQQHLLRSRGIDALADVGANEGQYASRARLIGYRRSIVSFEPSPIAAGRLQDRARSDSRWTVHSVAIGAVNARTQLNVSANSVSSSLLEMTEAHERAEPRSAYVSTVTVSVRPLDDFADQLGARVWLKIDVQGGEMAVLDGAARVLESTEVIQAELSLTELYRTAPTALELLTRLASAGFRLVNIERGFTDPASGALLQADGLFVRDGSGQ